MIKNRQEKKKRAQWGTPRDGPTHCFLHKSFNRKSWGNRGKKTGFGAAEKRRRAREKKKGKDIERRLNEDWTKIERRLNEDWTKMQEDARRWKKMKEDERRWKKNARKCKNMQEHARTCKKTKMNENERKWTKMNEQWTKNERKMNEQWKKMKENRVPFIIHGELEESPGRLSFFARRGANFFRMCIIP